MFRNARFAGLRMRLAALVMPGPGVNASPTRSCGHAQSLSASQRATCDGPAPTPRPSTDALIRGRAERVCNRNRKLVAAYIQQQTILGKGASYD